MKVLYIEWSPTPYTDCYLPGIDAAVRVSLSGIKIVGLSDENGNYPRFDCSSDPRRFNFLPFWTPYENVVVFNVSSLLFTNVVIPVIGPQLQVLFSDVTFIDSVVLSTSSSCEYLNISFQRVIFVANGPTLFPIHFTPVKNNIGEFLSTPVEYAGACLYCKSNYVYIRDTQVNSSIIAAVAFIRLQIFMTNIVNSGVSHHMANIILVLGTELLQYAPNFPNIVEIVAFHSFETWSNCSEAPEFSVIQIYCDSPLAHNILIKDSVFEKGSRALNISLKQLHQVHIASSTFRDNRATGMGGSVWCEFRSNWGGVIEIFNSTFLNNKATITTSSIGTQSFSAGGAIYITSKLYKCTEIDTPNVKISSSYFYNNVAQAFGGSLYLGIGIFVSITDTDMIYNASEFSWNGDLISAVCRIQFTGVNITVDSTNGATSSIDFISAFEDAFIKPSELYIQCPVGHFLDLRYLLITDGELYGAFSSLQSFCRRCSEKEYTPHFGYAYLNYTEESEQFSVENNIHENKVECLPCPYGGECNVGLLRARPKFWGYCDGGEYYFQRCPNGYCCNGDSIPCRTFDTCASGRVGTLCGHCQDGYSESVLSADCLKDENCDDFWVWPICILGAAFYIFYYSFKSELTNVCIMVFKSLINKCEDCKNRGGNPDKVNVEIRKVKRLSASAVTLNTETTASRSPSPERVVRRPSAASLSSTQSSTQQSSLSIRKFVSNKKPAKSAVQWATLMTKLSHLDPREKNRLMGHENAEGIDRGYLGIVTYFAQASALMRVHVEFAAITYSSVLDKIEQYTVKYLDFDVYQVELEVCPFAGINALFKALIKTLFVLTIYGLWLMLFITTYFVFLCSKPNTKPKILAKNFYLKLMEGLVEIIKYTFSSLAGSNFSLLTCVYIGSLFVWKFDGTVTCFQGWQGIAALFLLFYTIPFSFSLALGTKLLKDGKISSVHFIFSCILPLPFCIIWLFMYLVKWRKIRQATRSTNENTKAPETKKLSDATEVILDVLQGPYRNDDETVISVPSLFFKGNDNNNTGPNDKSKISNLSSAVYWEGIMEFRRLVLNCLTLVNNDIIRLTLISVTCLVILLHHAYVKPFRLARSNKAETLSLSFLLVISAMNAIKAAFSENGVIPEGPNETLLRFFQRADNIFLFLLISFIILIELACFFQARYKRKTK